ncbi:bacteriophage T4 gp5 trimerisation domain-containing protein [Halarcobacter anaerophilus]|uniref:bacteriophage T4 gp5 trimerisation domain-containing protein n=1 Tax=Halarcobacter anaerophilus TaxID=877500 RepID=UPI003B8A931D
MRTASTPAYEDSLGYNEINFDDTKENEKLFIRAQLDYELYAKHDFNILYAKSEFLQICETPIVKRSLKLVS